METNETVDWEGNYIHTGNGMHGKILWHDSTTMNVKWYPAWQWSIIGLWLAFWKWAAQQSVHWTSGIIPLKLNYSHLWHFLPQKVSGVPPVASNATVRRLYEHSNYYIGNSSYYSVGHY